MHLPQLTARIRKTGRSIHWQAIFYAWNAKKAAWVRCFKSTKTSNKLKAQVIADKYQELARRVGGRAADSAINREYILSVVNTILTVSGHDPVQESRKWDEYSKEWLSLQAPRVSERSLESYNSHVRQFTRWLETKKDTAVNLITGRLMQSWYDEMIDEGRKPATVNNTVKTLQAIFDRARAEGFCERNPAELVLRQYGEKYVRETFTPGDIAKILAYLRKPGFEEWLTVCLLGLCTGQRLQDCAQAKAEEFAGKGKHQVWRCKQRKTGAVVEVPLVEPLASHIISLKVSSGFLCPSLAGLPTGSPVGLSMGFSDILDAAGVVRERREKEDGSKGQTWTNKTFHSLRHTCNSLLANAGVSQEIRRQILGHASSRVNDGYTHLETQTMADALKKAMAGTA
ncbi:MAG: Tyrosine recombinase XerC [Prosthecobacter sp.]|nr:Tyrosine recombinase XerC [Prosthecobacter sp.]